MGRREGDLRATTLGIVERHAGKLSDEHIKSRTSSDGNFLAITYTITVTNNGPSNAVGATVADTIPASITGVSWTTSTTGSASVTAGATGSGNSLASTVSIAAGAGNSVIFTVSGTVAPATTGNLVNTATVTTPPGTTDSNPNNNTSTDTDTPNLVDVLDGCSAGAVVTPLLLADAYHARVDIPAQIARCSGSHRVRQADVLGEDARLVSVLRQRVTELGVSRIDDTLGVQRRGEQCLDRVDLESAGREVGDRRERLRVGPIARTLGASLLARVHQRDHLDIGVVAVRAHVEVVDPAEADERGAHRAVERSEVHPGSCCSSMVLPAG